MKAKVLILGLSILIFSCKNDPNVNNLQKEEVKPKKKVSINDEEYKLVSEKEASKKPEPSTWQKFRIWLDPHKQNIRKGE